MQLRPQWIVEIAVPLIIAYVFLGAPIPSFISHSTGTSETLGSSPILFSRENLDWAVETLAFPDADSKVWCPHHDFVAHVFSRDPLVIYIENFLSAAEVAHLLESR